MKLKPIGTDDRTLGYAFWCPGCQAKHWYMTGGNGLTWRFNGDLERPTFEPSLLLAKDEPKRRCHMFVTDGKIQYLHDCHHALAGQTVPLSDLSEEGDG